MKMYPSLDISFLSVPINIFMHIHYVSLPSAAKGTQKKMLSPPKKKIKKFQQPSNPLIDREMEIKKQDA